MKTAYTKYIVMALSIAALSSISLSSQAHGHHYNSGYGHGYYNSYDDGYYGGYYGDNYYGHSSYGHGYSGGHGYNGGHGNYRRNNYAGHSGYSQQRHGVNLLPSVSANIRLPGLRLNLH